MSWPCKFLESPPLKSFEMPEYEHNGERVAAATHWYVDWAELPIGSMWYMRGDDGEVLRPKQGDGKSLSDYYFLRNAHRPPLMVLLPDRTARTGRMVFCVDWKCHSKERGHYDGWTVSGEPPNINVHPSIDAGASYHGFLTGGVVGDG